MSETEHDLTRWLQRLRPKMSAILASFRIPPEDGEDLLQNVCLQFLRKRAHVREPDKWLPGALRNECRMYLRTRSRRFTVAVDDALLDLMNDESSATPPQERAVLRRNLGRWIAQLDRRCRSILRLRYHLGHETREVAEALGYRPSSVDKVTRRCLDALGRKVVAALPSTRRTP